MEEGTRKWNNKGEQRNDEDGVKIGTNLKKEKEIRTGRERLRAEIWDQLQECWWLKNKKNKLKKKCLLGWCFQYDWVETNWELFLHSQHISGEMMGSQGLIRVVKPHAEHPVSLFSMATPVSF